MEDFLGRFQPLTYLGDDIVYFPIKFLFFGACLNLVSKRPLIGRHVLSSKVLGALHWMACASVARRFRSKSAEKGWKAREKSAMSNFLDISSACFEFLTLVCRWKFKFSAKIKNRYIGTIATAEKKSQRAFQNHYFCDKSLLLGTLSLIMQAMGK